MINVFVRIVKFNLAKTVFLICTQKVKLNIGYYPHKLGIK